MRRLSRQAALPSLSVLVEPVVQSDGLPGIDAWSRRRDVSAASAFFVSASEQIHGVRVAGWSGK